FRDIAHSYLDWQRATSRSRDELRKQVRPALPSQVLTPCATRNNSAGKKSYTVACTAPAKTSSPLQPSGLALSLPNPIAPAAWSGRLPRRRPSPDCPAAL